MQDSHNFSTFRVYVSVRALEVNKHTLKTTLTFLYFDDRLEGAMITGLGYRVVPRFGDFLLNLVAKQPADSL